MSTTQKTKKPRKLKHTVETSPKKLDYTATMMPTQDGQLKTVLQSNRGKPDQFETMEMLTRDFCTFPANNTENMEGNVGIPPFLEDLLYMEGDGINDQRIQEVPDSSTDATYMNQNEKIIEAMTMALETGELTPLIKEELRCSIQFRRLAQGKDELQVNFEEPQFSELRPEEIEKAGRRREQNRLAAQRFRQRQRSVRNVLTKKLQKIEADNTRLRAELSKLRTERDHLSKTLNDHLMICPLNNYSWKS